MSKQGSTEITVTIENAMDGRVKRFTLPENVTVKSVIAALVKKWNLPVLEASEDLPYSLVHVLDLELKMSELSQAVQSYRLRLIPKEPEDSGEGEHTTLGFFPGLVKPGGQAVKPLSPEPKSPPLQQPSKPAQPLESPSSKPLQPATSSDSTDQKSARGAYMIVCMSTNKKRRLALPKQTPIRRVLPILAKQFGLDQTAPGELYRLRYQDQDLNPNDTLAEIPEESEMEILVGPKQEMPVTVVEEVSGKEVEIILPKDLRTPWLSKRVEDVFGKADPEGIMEYELFYNNRHLLAYDTLERAGVPPHATLKLMRVERTVFVIVRNAIDRDEQKIYLPASRAIKDLLPGITNKLRIPKPDENGRFIYKMFYGDKLVDPNDTLSKIGVKTGDKLEILLSRPATVFVKIIEEESQEEIGIPISDNVQVRELLPGIIHRMDLPLIENSLPIAYKLRFGNRTLKPIEDLASIGIKDQSKLILFRDKANMVNITAIYPNTGDRIIIDLPPHLEIEQIIPILINRMGLSTTDRKGVINYVLNYNDRPLDVENTLEEAGISGKVELTILRRAL